MLICEKDDGLIIGHQCGFHLPQDLGQSVFATMLDKVEPINSPVDITKLLQETTQRSYEIPNVIAYHYLTAITLHKIIEQANMDKFTLRFTHIDYMNDTMDGKYGHNEFITAVKYILEDVKKNDSEVFQELRNKLCEEFSKLLTTSPCTRNKKFGTLFMVNGKLCDAYVCSLSLDPESISLWKSYGGGFAESYAIGIKTKKLTNINVCRIEYSDHGRERRYLPVMIIQKIIDLCNNCVINKSDIHDMVTAVIEFSSAWSISHKDYYWAHENEVRLVKFVPSGKKPDGYSVFNGVFRPYIEEQFDKKCVTEVIVGPMIERYNAAKSIDAFMGSNGFGGGREALKVRCSVLPIRS